MHVARVVTQMISLTPTGTAALPADGLFGLWPVVNRALAEMEGGGLSATLGSHGLSRCNVALFLERPDPGAANFFKNPMKPNEPRGSPQDFGRKPRWHGAIAPARPDSVG
jgi:hypothetical protein